MSFSRSLFAVALLACVALASAHHIDAPELGLISCRGFVDCNGSNTTEVAHDGCAAYNMTLGECTRLEEAQFGGATDVYAKLYCDQNSGKAYIASFGSDSACATLRTVTIQSLDECAQSNLAVCRDYHLAPPANLLAPSYISVSQCSDNGCSGETCAETLYATDKCYTDDEMDGYRFDGCQSDGADSYTLQEHFWSGAEHSMHCHNGVNTNQTFAVNQCGEYVSETTTTYIRYGCGNTVPGAASFASPAVGLLAMLAAMLAVIRFAQ